jgi:hypothetical protein
MSMSVQNWTEETASLRNPSSFVLCYSIALCMSATIVMAAQQPLVGPAHPYPTKPIRLLTAATPDSGPEVIARHLAAKLTEA